MPAAHEDDWLTPRDIRAIKRMERDRQWWMHPDPLAREWEMLQKLPPGRRARYGTKRP